MKKVPRNEITQEMVKAVIRYDPQTGIFHWIATHTAAGGPRKRQQAGCFDKSGGYRTVSIFGNQVREHRLAWFYVHGKWPTPTVDHKNMIKDDNRIVNLREATFGQNGENKGISRRNKSGIRGIHFDNKHQTWVMDISIDGQRNRCRLKTKEDALCRLHKLLDLAGPNYVCAVFQVGQP